MRPRRVQASPDDGAPRAAWDERVPLPVLVALAVVIVLGAWRQPYRPAWLDAPADASAAALRWVDIYPGLAVFDSRFQIPNLSRVVRARCLDVLGWSGSEPPRRLYPDDGTSCPPTGVQLRHSPEEILLARLMMWATEDESRRRMENVPPPPAGEATVSQVLLPIVGYYFDRRERQHGTPRDTLLFRYTHHVVDTDTDERFEVPVVVFRVTVGGGPIQAAWFPTPEQAARLWPEPAPR